MKKIEAKWIPYLVCGIILIVVYKSVDNIGPILRSALGILKHFVPLLVGCVIALFLIRPVHRLSAVLKKSKHGILRKLSKQISVAVVYITLILAVALAVKYIIPVLYKNVEDLISKLPGYISQINRFLAKYEMFPKIDYTVIGNFLLNYFDLDALNKYVGLITDIASSFVSLLVSLIISVYIILDYDEIKAFFRTLNNVFIKHSKKDVIIGYGYKMADMFYSYFIGLFIDSVLIGCITWAVFGIFRVPYAAFLGLIVGIGNMIPFFGPIVSAVVVYLLGAISFGPIQAIWMLIFQFVLGQIDGNVIQPKIIGSQVGIRPLLVLVSVTVFGGVFGPLGMILGVPIVAAFKMVLDDYLDNAKIDNSR